MSLRLASAIFLASAGPALAQDPPAAPTVSVTGYADAEVRPDIAIVTLVVTDDKATANDASAENARLAAAVIDGLKGSGVDVKDISTVGLSMYPVMADAKDPKTGQPIKPTITTFRASNTIEVRVRDIDRTGAFIAASVQNGALYRGVGFDLSDRAAREDALRSQAVVNARHRAELYAQGASMKLGALRSIVADGESAPASVKGMARMNLAAGAPTPVTIEPGVITLTQSVNVTWELAAP